MRRFFPTPERIRNSRWLRWLGPRLHDRELWHVRRRAVARGVAIGLFFAFLLPVGQIPIAVLVALAARANVWASAAATLVSNPFTFAPIVFVAYRLGAWLVGAPDAGAAAGLDPSLELGLAGWVAFWWDRLNALGKPLIAGLVMVATTASLTGYVATMVIWRVVISLKRRRTLREREAR